MEYRYFIRFKYHGVAFHGWQKQPNAHTVQAEMEKAFYFLLGKHTEVIAAGRTDTGVHAKEMWAHFQVEKEVDAVQLRYRLNSFLPKQISIEEIRPVQLDAHARFSAVLRSYEYHIHYHKNPFLEDRSWQVRRLPDKDLLSQAASIVLEFDEFSAFTRSNDAAQHHRCHIFESMWEHQRDCSVFKVSANRFLRNMVRAMVGTMMEMAWGRIDAEGMRRIIASGDRRKAGESAPAQGLFLTKVEYPKEIFLCQK